MWPPEAALTSQGSRSGCESQRKRHDAAEQFEHHVDGKPHQPEWKQQDPHERVDDQRQQGERPTQHEQDAPEQELRHTWTYDRRSDRFSPCDCHEARMKEAVWIPVWLDQCAQDVRYALRTIRRAPGFAAIAVGSSALGIGACAVIFAILNFAVFKPLPVQEPGRLMSLSQSDRRTGEAGNELSYPDFRDVRQARALDGIAGYTSLLPASIGSQSDPQRHWGTLATANYFAV